jgi:hypothetical protein
MQTQTGGEGFGWIAIVVACISSATTIIVACIQAKTKRKSKRKQVRSKVKLEGVKELASVQSVKPAHQGEILKNLCSNDEPVK